MKRLIRKALPVGVLAAGFVLASGGAAHAATNAGIGDGNIVTTTVSAPINIRNNALAIGAFARPGDSSSNSSSGTGNSAGTNAHTWSKVKPAGHTWSAWHWSSTSGNSASTNAADDNTGGNAGVGNGNSISTSINAPVTVCGNAIAISGFASASC